MLTLSIGSRIGVYEVIAKLGQGGMGEVYRARDTRLEREVAIKVLPTSVAGDADRIMRFEREAKTLAALNHPHIAHIHGIEDSGATRALVMELVEGEDLAQRLARGAIPLDESLAIAEQIADALQAAHAAGIVHRDLKPASSAICGHGPGPSGGNWLMPHPPVRFHEPRDNSRMTNGAICSADATDGRVVT